MPPLFQETDISDLGHSALPAVEREDLHAGSFPRGGSVAFPSLVPDAVHQSIAKGYPARQKKRPAGLAVRAFIALVETPSKSVLSQSSSLLPFAISRRLPTMIRIILVRKESASTLKTTSRPRVFNRARSTVRIVFPGHSSVRQNARKSCGPSNSRTAPLALRQSYPSPGCHRT